jgi:hypothetical protein
MGRGGFGLLRREVCGLGQRPSESRPLRASDQRAFSLTVVAALPLRSRR